ncbi:MAG TPA: DUF1223 domain-containing protein [Bryobacteraceae bacterium]|jgi:hypothetical protein
MKHWQANCVLLLAAVLPASGAGADRAPVLVELFTSESSVSCPPADQLLAKLDTTAVVLGEHVTTWDSALWRDRLASEDLTKRQQAYADRFRLEGVYAPQMVVNGAVQFSGSDATRATVEIRKAAKRVKIVPRLLWADGGVQVEIDGAHVGDRVFLALAEDSATTDVTGGSNKGHQLHHVAVCRQIVRAGLVPLGGAFYQLVKLPPQTRKQRAIVWVQVGDVGVVAGAAMIPPADQ